MKWAALASLFFLVCSSVLAQDAAPQTNPDWFSQDTRYIEDDAKQSLSQFYQHKHNGRMNFNFSGEFVGTAFSLLTRGSDQLLYGLNLEIMSSTINSAPGVNNQYRIAALTSSQTTLLVPLWFTMKIRLTDARNSRVSPYLLGGFGPALVVSYRSGFDLFNSFGDAQSYLGGGGFVGSGFEFLWAEDWAIFADVRYNVIRFERSIGLNQNYDGFSLSVGFTRAFGL